MTPNKEMADPAASPSRRDDAPDRDDDRRAKWALFGLGASALALTFLLAVGAGYATALVERALPPSTGAMVFVALIAALIAASGWVLLRSLRALRATSTGFARRDRRNAKFAVMLFVVGVLMGGGITFADRDTVESGFSLLGTGPLDPRLSLVFAFVIVVVLPMCYWYYHRHVVDELEEAAYRQGALYALYSYATLAPAWWMLWRGGWTGEPDGVVIFLVTMLVWLAALLWAKYR